MRSYSRKRKNNIIIGTLCGVMLLMVVGYAAFASQLNIKGTSGISSNWDIEITNIRGGNPFGGDAYDISEPTYTPTTATFNTGLKTPWNWSTRNGSYRMYEVEVTNKGTLTGLVTIASLSCGDNDAIGCGVEVDYENDRWFDDNWNELDNNNYISIDEGQQDYSDIEFTLAPGEKHYIYVSVYYEDVTSQPENLSANIDLELTYEQDGLDENGVSKPKFNGEIYRWNSTTVSNGNKIETIGGITTDYQTLEKNYFLKHSIVDGRVQNTEVCFIKDGLHCLKPNEYETNKTMLLSVFGESACYITDDSIGCDDDLIHVEFYTRMTMVYNSVEEGCYINNGQSFCGMMPK